MVELLGHVRNVLRHGITRWSTGRCDGERVLHMIGQSHQVLVIAEEKEALGFVVMSIDESLSTGEIQ